MNEDAIGGGFGAILGAVVLQKMIEEVPSAADALSTITWMPPLLVVLGIFLVIAGIAGVE